MSAASDLQYLPFSSLVDLSFWHQLMHRKIHEYKLDQKPKNIFGYFNTDSADNLPALASFEYNSFCEITEKANSHVLYGKVFIFNTIEEFRDLDKNQFLQEQGQLILKEIFSKSIDQLNLNETLNSFLLLTYLDIKKYKCYYWFAFPAFSYPQKCQIITTFSPIEHLFDNQQLNQLLKLYQELPIEKRSFFLITLNEKDHLLTVKELHQYENELQTENKILIAFADPSKNDTYPGWPLRNLLTLLSLKFKQDTYEMIAIRVQKNSLKPSKYFKVKIDQIPAKTVTPESFKIVGYEKNAKQKLLPKMIDISNSMDPKKLAENAIDLNLKLMKWRLMPDLNLEKIAKTKCLLLGSGTLGCNVARSLLGWGVRNITMLDNGKVTFSNPSRQSLFEFSDCSPEQRNKSEAAVDCLKRIHPNINAKAVVLSIPMPGHPVESHLVDQNKKDCEHLERLIDEHDCVFLLMDTRESRWLPTMLCHYKQKLCINAALGFDTYLVQRHGIRNASNESNVVLTSVLRSNIPGYQLGCYFCSDVVAPGNSTKNRTLDQQCTVTRPGVSMIAAAIAVELMVSVLQHSKGANAPAWNALNQTRDNQSINRPNDADDHDYDEKSLGIIPHQIRGFLSHFNHVLPTCIAFNQCTACSAAIETAYEQHGHDFLLQVFNQTDYLEEITGLKRMHEQTNFDEIWALSDDEDLE